MPDCAGGYAVMKVSGDEVTAIIRSAGRGRGRGRAVLPRGGRYGLGFTPYVVLIDGLGEGRLMPIGALAGTTWISTSIRSPVGGPVGPRISRADSWLAGLLIPWRTRSRCKGRMTCIADLIAVYGDWALKPGVMRAQATKI